MLIGQECERPLGADWSADQELCGADWPGRWDFLSCDWPELILCMLIGQELLMLSADWLCTPVALS